MAQFANRRRWPLLALSALAGLAQIGPAPAAEEAKVRCPGGEREEARLFVERPFFARGRALSLLEGKPPAAPEEPFPFSGESCAVEVQDTGEPRQRLIALCGELRFELDLDGPRAGEPRDIDVPPPGRLAGRVAGPGGAAVAGAIVYLEKEEFPEAAPWRLGPSRTLSGADGSFSLPAYPESRLVVLAPGFLPGRWPIDDPAAAPAKFVLEPAAKGRISVFRKPGRPEPRVLVETLDRVPLGFTDENGQLAVAVEPATGLVFWDANGSEFWRIAAPPWRHGELETAVGGQIFASGKVLRADGSPAAGAVVGVRRFGSAGFTYGTATAGEDGVFRLQPLEPRAPASEPAWTLIYTARDHAEHRLDWSPEPGAFRPEIPLQQLVPGAELAGRVVDEQGHGIEGAEIYRWSPQEALARDARLELDDDEKPRAYSHQDGELRLGGVAAGEELALEVRAPGFLPRLVHGLRGGAAGIEIALSRGSRLAVLVQDEAGVPLPEVLLWLSKEGRQPPGEPSEFQARTDGAGRAFLPQVARGSYRLLVTGEGLLDLTRPLVVEGPETKVTLQLSRGAIVEGVVVGSDGTPVAGARIEADSEKHEIARAETGADGSYRVSGFTPGRVSITATTYAGEVAEGMAEVGPRPARLDLKVSRRLFELRGLLVDAAGRPAGGLPVYLEVRDEKPEGTTYGTTSATTAAGDGSFRFEVARARNYFLSATRDGAEEIELRRAEIEVEMTRSQSVVLRLPP